MGFRAEERRLCAIEKTLEEDTGFVDDERSTQASTPPEDGGLPTTARRRGGALLTDKEANLVYVSDRLVLTHAALVVQLRRILGEHGIPLKGLQGTRDIWCRDYMPVQVTPDEFVWFRYAPDYLRGHEHLNTAPSDVGPIPEIAQCVDVGIVLDGGNVVRWGSRCILTDKVFRENPDLQRDAVIRRLREALRVEDLILIQKEPFDVVGHADGVVRFLDDSLVVINGFSEVAPWYRKHLTSVLRRAGLEWVELPYRPEESSSSDIPSAVGCYANFLMVRGLVVVPVYHREDDDLACRVIEDNTSGMAIIPLDCTDLARGGGVLNCVTWTIAAS
jgi:agmatine deiminase